MKVKTLATTMPQTLYLPRDEHKKIDIKTEQLIITISTTNSLTTNNTFSVIYR